MNHPDATGVGQVPLNNPGGVRMSAAITYLDACRHRLNLTIRANVTVRRVVFDGAPPNPHGAPPTAHGSAPTAHGSAPTAHGEPVEPRAVGVEPDSSASIAHGEPVEPRAVGVEPDSSASIAHGEPVEPRAVGVEPDSSASIAHGEPVEPRAVGVEPDSSAPIAHGEPVEPRAAGVEPDSSAPTAHGELVEPRAAGVEPDSSAPIAHGELVEPRAVGVEVESNGKSYVVGGDEIILSAGAIASPQLLMLSGVGPAEHLRSIGIEPIHDLPGVGRSMKNHPSVSIVFRSQPDHHLAPDAPRNQVGLRFTANGSTERNDIQVQPTTSYPESRTAPDVRVGCRLEYPYSEGLLTLTSADVAVQPRLDFRFLTDPRDTERFRDAVRRTCAIFEHPTFSDLLAERLSPTDADLADDASLDAWLQQNAGIAGHTSVTCKMGPSSDPLAVVDQYCNVHGLQNLRVIDAAVMPDIVRANTNATIIMMAERAAEFVGEGR